MADAVVIGGGILGACAALHLHESGAGEVVLLESGAALGGETTAAGAGFVGYWAGELEAELAAYGMAFYTRLQEESGHDLGVRRNGLLFPAISEPGLEMLQQEYERELSFAPEVELVDADEACRLAPILARPAVHGGLFQPGAHQVDTRRVMAALERRLRSAGVDVRCATTAVRVGVTGSRVTSVETMQGEIPTGVAVNAAGAAAESLARRNDLRLGAVPLLESRFVTAPLPEAVESLPMLLFFERDLMYARPQSGGLLIGAIEREIGAHGRVSLDAPPPRGAHLPLDAMEDHERLARACADLMPPLAGFRVADRASGLPTWTPDGRHILGPAPGIEGYFVVAGDNESCVTHGPGLARLAAELIVGGGTEADISPYRVGRFEDLSDDELQQAAEQQYLARHPPADGSAPTPFGITLES
jgi:glycine/D-amino acid oxidase-like deaminating enzyme